MGQIFLLEVDYEDMYGGIFKDVIFAGVDCENILLEVSELLKERLCVLEGLQIIEIIEEKYTISESTKKYLLEQFPESEESSSYGDIIKNVSVRGIPLELL